AWHRRGIWQARGVHCRKHLSQRREHPPRRRHPDGAALIADERELLEVLVVTARAAGGEILRLVQAGFEVEAKSDQSPVTVCDRAAEQIILRALEAAAPGVPVIAEEEVAAGRIPAHGDTYFLVDPLDGTKEFVRGGDDYTVNIGLIVGGQPRLG